MPGDFDELLSVFLVAISGSLLLTSSASMNARPGKAAGLSGREVAKFESGVNTMCARINSHNGKQPITVHAIPRARVNGSLL